MVRPHVALVLLITCGQVNSFLYPINLKSSSAAFSGCPHLMAPKSKVARPAGAVGVVMRGFDPSKKQSRNALNSGARHGAKRRLTSLRAAADANEKARFKRWIRGDEESRRKMWQEWRESLPPEQQQLALENEWLPWEEYDFDQRMTDRGVGHHDEEGKFVEREAGREIIWDKDPDGRFVLLQCPVEKLPICVLDKQRFLAEHPGWFKDRAIFEDLYLGLVKKSLADKLTDLEYAELGRLYMRYQHVLSADPLVGFIQYYIAQRGLTMEEFFEVTRAIHEIGTVYDFDALGKSKSSGIGDMAVEFITGQDEYGDGLDGTEGLEVQVAGTGPGQDADTGGLGIAMDSDIEPAGP